MLEVQASEVEVGAAEGSEDSIAVVVGAALEVTVDEAEEVT